MKIMPPLDLPQRCAAAFPDFDYSIAPLIAQLGADWEDSSYRNDACPSAFNEALDWSIFFDYADPSQSEFPEARAEGTMNRYQIQDSFGDLLFASDDWNAIARFIIGKA